MMTLRANYIPMLLIAIILFATPVTIIAAQKPVSVGMTGDKAEATYLTGNTYPVQNDIPSGPAVIQGDFLHQGDRFFTDKDAKIELKLPDESYIRFDERTTFELIESAFDLKEKKRSIHINMILGKTWANVSKLIGGRRGNFKVTTKTAVMGVRGTVFRVNVQEDDTTIVKVYWGEILVNSKKQPAASPPSPQLAKPSRVMGPKPIAGPKPVSMEEWTYIVKSMQQIIVRPDGTATKPFSFSPQEDLNDWVRWNKERDALLENQ